MSNTNYKPYRPLFGWTARATYALPPCQFGVTQKLWSYPSPGGTCSLCKCTIFFITQLLDRDSSTVIHMNFNLMPSRYSSPEVSVHANPWQFLRLLECCRLVSDPCNPRRSNDRSSTRSCASSIPSYRRPILHRICYIGILKLKSCYFLVIEIKERKYCS